MTTHIGNIKQSEEYVTFTGVLSNMRIDGNRFEAYMRDDTGCIRVFGFDDAIETKCPFLKNGKTYVMYRMQAKARRDIETAAEVKVTKFSRIEEAMPMKLTVRAVNICDVGTHAGDVVDVVGILGELESTGGDDPLVKCDMYDDSANVQVFFTKEVSKEDIPTEEVVRITGKVTSKNNIFVSSPPTLVEDDGTHREMMDAFQRQPKKIKIDFSNLGDVKEAQAGTKGVFKGVVKTIAPNASKAENGARKRTMTIADTSMHTVQVTIFDEGADTPISIGDVVRFEGSVSSYNRKSLTTKAPEVVTDDTLKEWFVDNAYGTFEEISDVSS